MLYLICLLQFSVSEINTVQQLKKEALLKHKKRKAIKKLDLHEEHIIHNSPLGMEITSQSESTDKTIETCTNKGRKSTPKGIKKAKVRQQEM